MCLLHVLDYYSKTCGQAAQVEEEEEGSAQEEKKYSVTAEARGKTPPLNIYYS